MRKAAMAIGTFFKLTVEAKRCKYYKKGRKGGREGGREEGRPGTYP